MKTKVVLLLYCFFIVACVGEKSSKKQILSYVIEAEKNALRADIYGTIDEDRRIIILDSKVLPINRNLVATFDAIGKIFIGNISQISGEISNNYSSDLTYTVVAEDESSITYTVKSSPLSSDDAITDFRVNVIQNGKTQVIQGAINDQSSTITLHVPSNNWIDNIENAIATFTSKGLVKIGDIEQISGITPNDYRHELIYTVTLEDSSEKRYNVILVSPQSTGLPVVKIEIEGGANAIKDKENYMPSFVRLSDASHPEYNFEGKEAGIRGRGNVTWTYPKKPYRLKFDKKISVFGLGEAKSWVLLANYRDPTLIMNTVAFELGHKLTFPYTNHANHVEMFVNEEYKGSYMLTEQVQVDKYRIDIDEKKDFFVELDTYYDEEIKFKSALINLPVNVKSPEVKNESEIEFVKIAINNLLEAMFGVSSNFPNNNYKDLIDIKSVIDFLIVNEVTGNRDLYRPNSTYMYKVENQKIHMGPLWDFDYGFGKKDGSSNQDFFYTEGMYFYNKSSTSESGESFFMQFFKDSEFRSEYKKRWNEVKSSISDIDIFIQEMGIYLQKSTIENKEVWTHNLDHADQINKMRTWLKERIAYLDTQINKF
ncbi:hypothetical protein EZS27_010860 [termite gut metagenome]|uniref:CotH protein n=1 Tax=termite gut metagenome TaxID=433724 RepID=A0A5J4S7D6_9ZZZZ